MNIVCCRYRLIRFMNPFTSRLRCCATVRGHDHTYGRDIIEQVGMSFCKSTSTPVDTTSKLSAHDSPPVADPSLFCSLAGALQYLTFTRPDISYAIQQICLHMHDPQESHLTALKLGMGMGLVLLELFSIPHLPVLIFHMQFSMHDHQEKHLTAMKVETHNLLCSGDFTVGRSTSGYCVFLGDNLISWLAKREFTLSRSSTDSEYRAVANVVAETYWLRNSLLELHCPISKATLVYCDNVAKGHVLILHVPSRFNIADIFTKGLPRILFDEFRSVQSQYP
ncbi:uncharacterized mitochondrial protein AtMg00810-like [Amaranthus tricolor]|uniref:uncharacterized mitochondrial protein AtMg00810-like n=1 Tax=Amaranthus tricolor TaxID=29722 RepID=UPI002585F435|nr:uncharacterized mitochondrial protein AtMg00810-like [Amaranthus tricolor]